MLDHTTSLELQSLVASERIASLGAGARATVSAATTSDRVEQSRLDAHGGARTCPPVPGARPAATA